jgi:hypothetical protein
LLDGAKALLDARQSFQHASHTRSSHGCGGRLEAIIPLRPFSQSAARLAAPRGWSLRRELGQRRISRRWGVHRQRRFAGR